MEKIHYYKFALKFCFFLFSFSFSFSFSLLHHNDRQTHYAIVAPRHVRPHLDYKVALTLYQCNQRNALDNDARANSTAVVRIAIVDHETNYKNERKIALKANNKTRLISLRMDDIKYYRTYRFIAEGISGLKFKENITLKTEIKNISLLIQTDKAIYKPADVIKFRVLVLDYKLRPADTSAKLLNIHILVKWNICFFLLSFFVYPI